MVLIKNIKLIALATFWMVSATTIGQVFTLEQCIDSAWSNNARIKVLNQKQLLIDEKAKEVKANLIPKVYLNGDYKYFIDLPYQLMPQSIFGGPEGNFKAVQFGVPHVITANATIQIPIYLGQIYAAVEKVDLSKAELAVQIEKTKEDIFVDITNLYRNVQLLQNRLLFLETSIQYSQSLCKTANNLYKADLATSTDVKKVQLQVMVLENQQLTVKSSINQILDALKVYMGMPIEEQLLVTSEIAEFKAKLYEEKTPVAIELLQLKQQGLEADIKALQKTRYLPDVASYGSLGTSGFGYNSTNNSFLDFYATNFVGIKATYPIFNGTVTNKQIKQKQYELGIASIEQDALNDQHILTLQKAKSDLNIANKNLELVDSQLSLMTEIFEESELLYKEGLASTADVLQVNTELLQMQQNRITALLDCYAADLEIKRITRNILK
ncbi:MAG: TolC family protein [Putridiphycobacter sp.]|nr:TolC family protein [Putridiphycobacter sp.]